MKTRFSSVRVAAVALVGMLACVGCSDAGGDSGGHGEPRNLRIGFVGSPEALGGGDMIKVFKTQVEEGSSGAVTVTRFDNGQLGGEVEMLSSVRQGNLDVLLLNSAVLAGVSPEFNITELPYFWPDRDTLREVVFEGEVGDMLFSSLEEKGIHGLGFGEFGARALISTKPVNSLADVDGLRVRVLENPMYEDTWQALGATTIVTPWTEVYTGLQQGVMDAVDSNPMGFEDSNLYEVAEHLVRTDHIYSVIVLIVNGDVWQDLSPEEQAVLEKAASAGEAANWERAATFNEDSIQRMIDSGATLWEPDLSEFREAAAGVGQAYETAIGTEIVTVARDAIEH